MKTKFEYTAYTSQQDGCLHEHFGTLEGARRKAIKYAKEAFPAWDYKGYGPKIVVRDPVTKERLIEEKL